MTTMKLRYSWNFSFSSSGAVLPRYRRIGAEIARDTSALLRLWCHHLGTMSGARAMTRSSATNGRAVMSGSSVACISWHHAAAGTGACARAPGRRAPARDDHHPLGPGSPEDVPVLPGE